MEGVPRPPWAPAMTARQVVTSAATSEFTTELELTFTEVEPRPIDEERTRAIEFQEARAREACDAIFQVLVQWQTREYPTARAAIRTIWSILMTMAQDLQIHKRTHRTT